MWHCRSKMNKSPTAYQLSNVWTVHSLISIHTWFISGLMHDLTWPNCWPSDTVPTGEHMDMLLCGQDAHVSVKACEGLVLLASSPNDSCARHMLTDTEFTEQITSRLCRLYHALPNVMDPADIESVDAKWGWVSWSSIKFWPDWKSNI